MSAPLIWCVGFAYLVVAVDQFRKGEVGMGVAWVGYAIGNLGLGMAAK